MPSPIEIIGGGLAGLSLGLALRRAGVPVRLLEAGDYPRHRVCGEFITGLDAGTIGTLGLQPILADALAHREIAWFMGGRPARIHALPAPALGISRHRLDARLASAFVAAGGELRARTRVSDLAARAGRVFAIGRRRGASDWLGLKLHVRGPRLHRDLELHLGAEAYVGLSRVEDNWINVCGLFRTRSGGELTTPARPRWLEPRRNAGDPVAAPPAAIFFRYLEAARLGALAERLADAEMDPGSFCSVAALQFDRRVIATDRIQLGDACAMIPPFTGNGMAMAFQSAATAVAPLLRYCRNEIAWPEACRATNEALRRRFRVRLASANLLHPFLLRRTRQRGLHILSRTGLLPFPPLYALLH